MAQPAIAFTPEFDALFRQSRIATQAELNASTGHAGTAAVAVLLFSGWDWFVDPNGWGRALVIRVVAATAIVATAVLQRASGRVDWAPAISKLRFSASVLAVAGANAVLQDGYVVGLAGLVAALLGGPYIVIDRRDFLFLSVTELALVAAIMWGIDLDRFAVINAWIFLALTLVVGLMLARVFEATNRRAFALEQELTREARTDALTGLANRRSLEETASLELRRQVRSGEPLAVVLGDIDHFKAINDERGHDMGDRTICEVGERLRSVMRATDTLGRWGGEEFIAILPETDEAEAATLAERMRAIVEASPIPGDQDLRVTISLGVAAISHDAASGVSPGPFDPVLKAADHALYRAKAAGRNRVVRAGDSGAP